MMFNIFINGINKRIEEMSIKFADVIKLRDRGEDTINITGNRISWLKRILIDLNIASTTI